jgi:hypothetical protein
MIAGLDVGGGRYNETYTEGEGRIRGNGTLSTKSGATLVTGQHMPAGTKIPLSAVAFHDNRPAPPCAGLLDC